MQEFQTSTRRENKVDHATEVMSGRSYFMTMDDGIARQKLANSTNTVFHPSKNQSNDKITNVFN